MRGPTESPVAIGPVGRGGSRLAGRAGGAGPVAAALAASGKGVKLFAIAITVRSNVFAAALS